MHLSGLSLLVAFNDGAQVTCPYHPTRCPVLPWAIGLRSCYALSGTDRCYRPTQLRSAVRYGLMLSRHAAATRSPVLTYAVPLLRPPGSRRGLGATECRQGHGRAEETSGRLHRGGASGYFQRAAGASHGARALVPVCAAR
eukprot:1333770-Rhodomonas_salina.3